MAIVAKSIVDRIEIAVGADAAARGAQIITLTGAWDDVALAWVGSPTPVFSNVSTSDDDGIATTLASVLGDPVANLTASLEAAQADAQAKQATINGLQGDLSDADAATTTAWVHSVASLTTDKTTLTAQLATVNGQLAGKTTDLATANGTIAIMTEVRAATAATASDHTSHPAARRCRHVRDGPSDTARHRHRRSPTAQAALDEAKPQISTLQTELAAAQGGGLNAMTLSLPNPRGPTVKHSLRYLSAPRCRFSRPTFLLLAPAGATMEAVADRRQHDDLVRSARSHNSGGFIKVYCGTQPANPDTALSGNTPAATFTFSSTAFGSPSHVSTTEEITASLVSSSVTAGKASCTATFARILESDATTVIADETVSTSGADINLNAGKLSPPVALSH